jgi:hypothetical protein
VGTGVVSVELPFHYGFYQRLSPGNTVIKGQQESAEEGKSMKSVKLNNMGEATVTFSVSQKS